SSSLDNHSTLTIATGRTLTINGGGLRNIGALNLNGGVIAGTGGILNDFSGQMNARGTLNSGLSNFGLLQTTALLSASLGGNNSGGELRIADFSSLNVFTPFASSGTIVLQGASSNLSGGAINNTGTISGKGRINNTINNSGVIRAEGGLLTLAGPGANNTAS